MTHPHEALTKLPAHVDRSSMIPTGLRPDTKFETRLEAAERESRARSAQIKADMEASEAAGTLWTVHAAMYPGRVVAFLCFGKTEDEVARRAGMDGFAPAIFGPLHLIGKTHREAMFETFKLFTVDKIEITTIR